MCCKTQEKQIKAKQSIKEISQRWQTQRNQVADKVKKSMGHRTAIIPKVPLTFVSPAKIFPISL